MVVSLDRRPRKLDSGVGRYRVGALTEGKVGRLTPVSLSLRSPHVQAPAGRYCLLFGSPPSVSPGALFQTCPEVRLLMLSPRPLEAVTNVNLHSVLLKT